MFGKRKLSNQHIILGLSVFLIWHGGCAKPNYRSSSSEPTRPADQEKGQLSDCPGGCDLTFLRHQAYAKLEWLQSPQASQMLSFKLSFWKEGQPYSPLVDSSGLKLSVKLWMPSMGHGSSPVQIKEIQPGVFQVSRVYFLMPGAWDIHVQFLSATNVVDEAIYAISI